MCWRHWTLKALLTQQTPFSQSINAKPLFCACRLGVGFIFLSNWYWIQMPVFDIHRASRSFTNLCKNQTMAETLLGSIQIEYASSLRSISLNFHKSMRVWGLWGCGNEYFRFAGRHRINWFFDEARRHQRYHYDAWKLFRQKCASSIIHQGNACVFCLVNACIFKELAARKEFSEIRWRTWLMKKKMVAVATEQHTQETWEEGVWEFCLNDFLKLRIDFAWNEASDSLRN